MDLRYPNFAKNSRNDIFGYLQISIYYANILKDILAKNIDFVLKTVENNY